MINNCNTHNQFLVRSSYKLDISSSRKIAYQQNISRNYTLDCRICSALKRKKCSYSTNKYTSLRKNTKPIGGTRTERRLPKLSIQMLEGGHFDDKGKKQSMDNKITERKRWKLVSPSLKQRYKSQRYKTEQDSLSVSKSLYQLRHSSRELTFKFKDQENMIKVSPFKMVQQWPCEIMQAPYESVDSQLLKSQHQAIEQNHSVLKFPYTDLDSSYILSPKELRQIMIDRFNYRPK